MQKKTSQNDEWRKIEGEELGHKSSPVKANDNRCYEAPPVCIVPFLPRGRNNFYDLHSSRAMQICNLYFTTCCNLYRDEKCNCGCKNRETRKLKRRKDIHRDA